MIDPLPPPAIADVVAPLLTGYPPREASRYDRRAHAYVEPLAARALAAALAPVFAASYGLHLQGDDDSRLIARLRPETGTAEQITHDDFAQVVADALTRLPDASDGAPYVTVRAINHVRRLAEQGSASPYVRRVAEGIMNALPLLADLDPAPTLIRSGTASPEAAAIASERRRAYKREHARATRAQVRADGRDDLMTAAAWCSLWREQAPSGAHKATDVHRTYAARVEEADRTPVGRNTFYDIADEVCGERSRRGRLGAVYVVPEEVQPMTREQRRDLAALIVDKLTDEWRTAALDGLADLLAERQAEHVAASPASTVTDSAHVVDLAERRRARRAA
ncbi:hypothetical protein AB0L86_04895 [Micromonospora musae]|uniref:hypothetical protein n=1 Tax=Micromonospora musae TaxID=1894970 RepID=UPI00341F5CA4